ncbi:UBP-type zinc finger domain-containing protein [Frondihabitans australicus]|uniref:Ubiquitin-hydrolase Zn-finger-containing protein n=1 Tax=Frondihabitans australicus TaxID=386892 RepID=A0A495IJY1_9MICO|nr:UBP-type zinc finger domain-containing protein [Frondihabitans australicus]RKR76322.1 ubiquitin-hydrolase Zn-finger-containing protein [Frondihabitans australicus]
MGINEELINRAVPPSGSGCVECEQTGSWWFHLRRCASCGHIGCCDDSLNRHASRHVAQTGHFIIQSFEPNETWFWDYTVKDFIDGPRLANPQHHPLSQTVPGPAERVPSDWMDELANRP